MPSEATSRDDRFALFTYDVFRATTEQLRFEGIAPRAIDGYLQPNELLLVDSKEEKAFKLRLPVDPIPHLPDYTETPPEVRSKLLEVPTKPFKVAPGVDYKILRATSDLSKVLLTPDYDSNQLYVLDVKKLELSGVFDAPPWPKGQIEVWCMSGKDFSDDGESLLYTTELYSYPDGTISLQKTRLKYFNRNIDGELHLRSLGTKRDEVVTDMRGSSYGVRAEFLHNSKVYYVKDEIETYYNSTPPRRSVEGCTLVEYDHGKTRPITEFSRGVCTGDDITLGSAIRDALGLPQR